MGMGRWLTRRVEDPPQGPLRDGDVLVPLEQFGQVRPVGSLVLPRGQLDDACPQLRVGAVDGLPPSVAVDQSGGSVFQPCRQQTPDLAVRKAQHHRGLLEVDRPVPHVGEDVETLAGTRIVERIIWMSFHADDRDKIAGRLPRTESLAVHMSGRPR